MRPSSISSREPEPSGLLWKVIDLLQLLGLDCGGQLGSAFIARMITSTLLQTGRMFRCHIMC